MATFAVIRTTSGFMEMEGESTVYGELIEAENFAQAVEFLKENNSTDVLGTPLSKNITHDDPENEVFKFKNDRARYRGDEFSLELWEDE
jgi:hypothetical protein